MHSKQSLQEAMKQEQVHFSMGAMEALGRSAVAINESAQRNSSKKDSPSAQSSNIFRKIRDPTNQRHSSNQQQSVDGRGSEQSK